MSTENGNVAVLNPMLESHEDRLQRVESTCNETRVAVAEIGGQVEANHRFMLEKVESNHEFMLSKVESAFNRLDEKLTPIVASVAELKAQEAKDQASALVAKTKDRESTLRNAKYKKIGWGTLLAALGVIGGELGKTFWTWIVRP
jgi:hypothetical protein